MTVNNESVNLAPLALIPPTLPSSGNNGADVKFSRGIANIVAADADGDSYRMHRVPSNIVICDINICTTAITNGTDYVLGVSYPPSKGGAVISANCLMPTQTMASASKALDGFTAPTLPNRYKQLWELAGLTVDPGHNLDIVLTGNTVGTVDGTVVSELKYTAK